MKKILLKYFNLFALSGLLLAFVGCSDDNDSITPGPDVEEMPSIGTYSFRGEANKIVTGVASVDGDYLTCVLSPEKMDEGKTDTYFAFSLHLIWEGQVGDASTLYHNDLYVFIYEDPIYYVQRNSETNVTVKLNLRLHDGVRFKAEVTADLMKPSGEEPSE